MWTSGQMLTGEWIRGARCRLEVEQEDEPRGRSLLKGAGASTDDCPEAETSTWPAGPRAGAAVEGGTLKPGGVRAPGDGGVRGPTISACTNSPRGTQQGH